MNIDEFSQLALDNLKYAGFDEPDPVEIGRLAAREEFKRRAGLHRAPLAQRFAYLTALVTELTRLHIEDHLRLVDGELLSEEAYLEDQAAEALSDYERRRREAEEFARRHERRI